MVFLGSMMTTFRSRLYWGTTVCSYSPSVHPPHRHLHDLLPQPAPDGFKNSFEQAERKPFPALGKEEKEARRAGADESQSADVSVDAWVSVFVFLMLVKYACSSKITETQGDISEKCQTLFGVSVCTFKSLT